MSRLTDRLRRYSPTDSLPQPHDEHQIQKDGQGEYLPDSEAYQNMLAKEYEKNQKLAQEEYNKQQKMAEATNPHQLYTDIVTNPSPPDQYKMRIMGRPIDVNSLEQYLIFKISPRTITTLMRYNDAKSIEEIKGYTRGPNIKASKGLGLLILIIIGAFMMIAVGYLFLNGTIPNLLRGIMGGFGI